MADAFSEYVKKRRQQLLSGQNDTSDTFSKTVSAKRDELLRSGGGRVPSLPTSMPQVQQPESDPNDPFVKHVRNRKMDLGLIPDTRPKPERLGPPAPVKQPKPLPQMMSQQQPVQSLNPLANSDLIKSTQGDRAAQQRVQDRAKNTVVTQADVNRLAREKQGTTFAEPLLQAVDWALYENPVGQFITRGGHAAAEMVGPTAAIKPTTGNKAVDTVADVAGSIAGFAANPATGNMPGTSLLSGPYKQADAMMRTNMGQKVTQGIANQVGKVAGQRVGQKVAETAVRGGLAGAGQNVAQSAMRGESDVDQLAGAAALGAAFGAAGDLAFGALGSGIKKLMQRNKVPAAEIDEILALPGPRRGLPEGRPEANVGTNRAAPVMDETTMRIEQRVIDEYKALKQQNPNASKRDLYATARERVNNAGNQASSKLQVSDIPEFLRRGRSTEPTVQPIQEPPAPPQPRQRGFLGTVSSSDKTPQGFKDNLGDTTYQPITNADTLRQANGRLNSNVEDATSYVLGDTKFDAEKAATAQRLIDHYNQQGNYKMAVSVAEKAAAEATKAGQAIQALSMYNRLSPEGILIHAQRTAQRVNERIPKGVDKVTVSENMAHDLTNLAAAAQKMTGVKDLSNNVIDIMNRAKAGEKLSPEDSLTVKTFIEEAQQFVKDAGRKPKNPRPPNEPSDKRVKEALITYLDAQEQAAKERLRAKGIRISSNPLDIWADYAIIGATKMAKGTINFADWSAEMIKDLGQDIAPSLRSLYDRSREAFDLSNKKITRSTISQAERLTDKVINKHQLSGDEAEQMRQIAFKVSQLSGEAKTTASQDLQAILQTLDRPGLLKKIDTAQTIGQLLNPKTQVRNVLGNELMYRTERLSKILSTPIDIARSKLTGGPRYVTFRTNNQGEYWRNFMRGAKAGWKGVNVNGLQTQYDLASPAFTSKYNPLTYMEKALGAALKSFDTAAYMRAYNDTMGEMATLDAINRGLKPTKEYVQEFISKADDNIMQMADEYGKYVTMQDNNLISKGMHKFKRGLNLGKDFGLGSLILKYPKTPGAILMRALEYSPAGFLRSAKILAEPWLRNVEPNPQEATMALSRAIIGTFGLSGLGYYLMDNDVITGSASKDRDIRELEKSAGKGQYQVNMTALKRFVDSGFNPSSTKIQEGDLLYNYDWMQPLSIAVSLGANVNKNMNDTKDGQPLVTGLGSATYQSVGGAINTLTEQSLLQGVVRAVEGYPGQTVTDKLLDILSDIPSSFVPTFMNQIKQIGDNQRRETYSPDKFEQSLNKAKAKVPGLAQTLPGQYDTLGKPKQHYQDNNLFNIMLNPGFPSRYTLSPEAKFIVDLITETGDESLAPRVPSKKIDGQALTGDQFSRYSKRQGEETAKRISKIKPDLSTKSKVKRTGKALTDAGKKAKKEISKELGTR
ncbi:hypothetical protein [Paenibacillus taiwanensis]|uniref:hypothetical protein n=1 Tax=Paenibacillus taiwanensis TaxID=401638 RepID=UPI000409FEAC|nr:hypothetical protein [Paenibacillus taiwanensis]